jgi:hypothetical protein
LDVRADPRHKPLPVEPATLLTEGRVADAVRALCESHGIGKRQARKWIEAHIADDPMLQVQLETQRRARRRRIFLWALLLDAIIVASIIYYLLYLR